MRLGNLYFGLYRGVGFAYLTGYTFSMFSLFRRTTSATKTVALIDISSGSVACSIVRLNREGPPEILIAERAAVAANPSRGATGLMQTMQKSFLECAERLHASMAGVLASIPDEVLRQTLHPSHAAVFLRAPWSEVYLRNVRFARKEPFPVTPATRERMLVEYVRREKPDEKEDEIVERSAVGVRLNGYAVADIPPGTEVENVELTVVSPTAPKIFLGAVRDVLRARFGSVPVTFHSAGIASSFALASIMPEEPDYLLCETAGDMTEILLVLEHIPSGRATMPVGDNLFSRTLESHAGMSPAETSSILRIAAEETSSARHKLGKTLGAAQKQFAEEFIKSVRGFGEALSGVRSIRLLAEEPAAHWLRGALADNPSLKALFPQGFSVAPVDRALLNLHLGKSPLAVHNEASGDLSLGLLSLYTDARFDEHRAFNFTLT